MQDPVINTVDIVLIKPILGALHAAFVERDDAAEPFFGALALPGGYVRSSVDKSVGDAAQRVLLQKAAVEGVCLEEYGTFSGPHRDPRGWSITVAHFALFGPDAVLSQKLIWKPLDKLPGLAFDHKTIVESVVDRVRTKARYSTLPVRICRDEFTMPELHAAYELLRSEVIPRGSFLRKFAELDMVEPVAGEKRPSLKSRSAQLFRVKSQFRDRLVMRDRGL